MCDHPEYPYPLCKKRPSVPLTRCFLHIMTPLDSVKMFDASASRSGPRSEIMLCTLFRLRVLFFVGLDLLVVLVWFSPSLSYLTRATPVHIELKP